jgi:glutamyl-tRNA reductase
MIKGKNEQGQTNKLNPNFQKMQDIAADSFKELGYRRGITSDKKHLDKNEFVIQEQIKKIGKYKKAIKSLNSTVKGHIEDLKGDLSTYVEKSLKKAKKEVLEHQSDKVIDTFLELPTQVQKSLVKDILKVSNKISDKILKDKVKDLDIEPERKRRRRKPKPE